MYAIYVSVKWMWQNYTIKSTIKAIYYKRTSAQENIEYDSSKNA